MSNTNQTTGQVVSPTDPITGRYGGAHIDNQPLTVQAAAAATEGLILNSIDERIVKVRPMATPLDQLSRCGGARRCDSMTVNYYVSDFKPDSTRPTEVISVPPTKPGEDPEEFVVKVEEGIFEASETVLVPARGESHQPLVLYVTSRVEGDKNCYKMVAVNQSADTADTITDRNELVRMGRAACELDVQTAQFATLPKKNENLCQIFKMQVEESTLMKLARKEAGWNFSDQEESAIIDMRLGMEKNFLFGHKAKIFDANKGQYVYLTGGVWHQAGTDISINKESFDEAGLIELCSKAFVGKTGSKRKILLAGTNLMERLTKATGTRVVQSTETKVKWGLEFREIHSNYGTLFVLHSELFDVCGKEDCGLIIDPDYITKYVHIPFTCEKLDLRKSGQRNTDAVVVTEASCLVLRHPNTHCRVVAE